MPCKALGLVSAEEAARWQSRLTEALSSREDKSEGWTPEARARGEAHLQALRSDGRDSSRRAALESYVSTGVLGPEEAKEWEQDVDLADLEDEEETRADAFKGELGWLHAVVLGPPNPIGGLRLVAAELYDGGVVIRWHRLRTAPGHDLCADGGDSPAP